MLYEFLLKYDRIVYFFIFRYKKYKTYLRDDALVTNKTKRKIDNSPL